MQLYLENVSKKVFTFYDEDTWKPQHAKKGGPRGRPIFLVPPRPERLRRKLPLQNDRDCTPLEDPDKGWREHSVLGQIVVRIPPGPRRVYGRSLGLHEILVPPGRFIRPCPEDPGFPIVMCLNTFADFTTATSERHFCIFCSLII